MLGGGVHPAPLARLLAREVGDERAEHGLARGLARGLRAAHAHGRPVGIAYRVHHAAHCLRHQLGPTPVALRPGPAEG